MKVSNQYNYTAIRGELLKALRKGRTQGQVSRRLGYSFNQAYRWESGVSQIKWGEFVKYCRACKADLGSALRKSQGYDGPTERIDLILRETIGSQQLLSLAKELDLSRFSLQDWVNGKSEPPLDSLLKILQHFDSLLYFLEGLLGGEMVPCLEAEHTRRRKQLALFYEHPICGAILMCLRLKSYRELPVHKDGVIAKVLGISAEEEASYLQKLEETGVIHWHRKKLQASTDHFDTRGDREKENKLRIFWVQKGLEIAARTSTSGGRGNFGFGIIPVSAKKEALLQEAMTEFVSKAMAIAREPDDDTTSLRVLSLQLFNPGF